MLLILTVILAAMNNTPTHKFDVHDYVLEVMEHGQKFGYVLGQMRFFSYQLYNTHVNYIDNH